MQITKEELRNIYKNNSAEDAAKKLNISVPTLYKYLKLAEIELKGTNKLEIVQEV